MKKSASLAGIAGWLLFDWAAQPFFTLVTTFVFAPYFAAHVAPDPVTGQALWGFAAGIAGLAVAVLSPVLGAVADQAGGRKRWIATFSLALVAGCATLWWAAPDGAPLILILVAFAFATIGAEFATVFTNAMLPSLAGEGALGRLSGAGAAAGYAGGLVSLALMLTLIIANPGTGLTLAGFPPVFGLDHAGFEGERAAGPLSALWYILFVLPLFLFTPDVPRRLPLGRASRAGLRQLARTIVEASRFQHAFTFLLAHMVYADGLAALFTFGGIYAATTFGWSAQEIGIFAILLTITATLGSLAGGLLDDRIGSWRLAMLSLAAITVLCAALLSTTRERIFVVLSVAPAPEGAGAFSSAAEQTYMVLGLLLGLAAGPLQAASRTYLARIAPPDAMTEFFGLYALSGKVTAFAAPLLVGAMTAWTGDRRIGMAAILLFLVSGLFLLSKAGPAKRGG